MNEAQAIDALLANRWRSAFLLPRYTPLHWFECDVFELTKAGYFREYEIKLTVQDFKADARKEFGTNYEWVHGEGYRPKDHVVKHAALAQGSVNGPVEFWYVVPVGLVADADIPQWAGLIELHEEKYSSWGFHPRIKARAPRLHDQKCNPKIETHARGVCYWRMHSYRRATANFPLPEEFPPMDLVEQLQ